MRDPYAELARRAGLILDDMGRKALACVDLASPTALEQAVETLAVPETWFFRDREPFAYLARFAVSAPRPLRVLSAPCSTGEEPYSIAIALLEAGLAPGEFVIDAVDISAKGIEAARRAVYGKSSFRHPMPELVEKYFRQTGRGFHLKPDVASQVRFRQANLLEGLAPAAPYHVIFCRNLLIYLHAEARRTLIAALRDLLADEGTLFAGHSELPLFLEAGFGKVQHPRSFACRKQSAAPTAAPVAAARPAPRVLKRPVPVRPSPSDAEPGLDDARRLADQGRLAEAAAVCKRLARNAEVLYLLGLISQASDRLTEAEEYFSRALYLDPRHREALVHMSLLCESRGDTERGALFRDRARRVQQEGNA